jgi:hypothetical protein
MTLRVTCANPDCLQVFEVADRMANQTVPCPNCGTESHVPAGFEQKQGAENGKALHPARQHCPSCGAVLGVRAAVCPKCGADIRTGGLVQDTGRRRKRLDLGPILVGGGVVVGLLVLVGLIVFAIKLLTERAKKAPPPEAAAPAAVAQIEGPKEERKRVQVPESALGDLPALEQQMRALAREYRAELERTLGLMRGASQAERARHWASLYAFCMQRHLEAEAEQCWERAVALAPDDQQANQLLGRTESFSGVPVTAQQKAFLEGLRPCVRLVNLNPELSSHCVRVAGAGEVPLPCGREVELRLDAGAKVLEVAPQGGAEGPVQQIPLTLQPGLVYTIHLESAAAATQPQFDDLANMYTAVSQGQPVGGVRVDSDWQGQVRSISSGRARIEGLGSAPLTMQLTRNMDVLVISGTLSVGDRYSDEGEDVFFAKPDEPMRVAVDSVARSLVVRTGTFYRLRVDLADGLWGAVGTAQGDLAAEWARRKLALHLGKVTAENIAMEANGDFLGPWQVLLRTHKEMRAVNDEVQKELSLQGQAAAMPDSLDRARQLRAEPHERYAYLNWPRFRAALLTITRDSYPAILAQIDRLVTPGAEQSSAPGAGPAAERPGRPAFRPASAFDPHPVTLTQEQQAYAQMQVLPFLPDDAALREARDKWAALSLAGRVTAMTALEKVATPEVVSFLGQLSQESREPDLVAYALLSLGAIGTPQALNYCEAPAILPSTRMAGLAARVAAADPDALAEMTQSLKETDGAAQSLFVSYITQMETPAVLPALVQAEAACGSGSRGRIAEALARLRGQAAQAELVRLVAGGPVPPEILGMADPRSAVLLVRPVGEALLDGKGGGPAVDFLVANGSDAAIAYLQAAAAEGGDALALEGLLRTGTTGNIGAAGSAAALVELALLAKLQERWCLPGAEPGRLTWNVGVDASAGRGFLDRVYRESKNPKVRLAAARMLQQVGQKPDAEILVALAREVPAEARPAAPPAPAGSAQPRQRYGRGGPQAGPTEGSAGNVSEFELADFREPSGVPLVPGDFSLAAPVQLYALGLLMEDRDSDASRQLRTLADSYTDPTYKCAAMQGLAMIGGDENLAYLRARATARKESYSSQAEVLRELQDRLAALAAIGTAQDAGFLPRLLDILQENAPDKKAISGVEDEYAKLAVWWQLTLWSGACDAISRTCRQKPLFELTADSQLQQAVAKRLLGLITEPGPQAAALADARNSLQARAVIAFGRCASLRDDDTRLVLNRLAMMVSAQPAATPSQQPAGTTSAQEEAGPLDLRGALRDALAYMATHGGGTAVLLQVPSLLPAPGKVDAAWSNLMAQFAEAPTPDYFAVLLDVFGSLDAGSRQEILKRTKGKAGRSDLGYARFLARVIAGEGGGLPGLPGVTAPRAVAVGPAPDAGAGPPPEVLRQQEMEEAARVQEMVRVQEEADARRIQAYAGRQQRRMSTSRPRAITTTTTTTTRGAAPAPELKAERRGVHGQTTWGYDTTRQTESVATEQAQWELAELFLQDNAGAAAAAVQSEDLWLAPEVGAAIVGRCAQDAPGQRQEMVARLKDLLVGAEQAARVEIANLATRRAAVSALRRLGGDDAAGALLTALVGPEVQVQPVAGMEAGEGLRGMGGARATRGMAAAPAGGALVAPYAARALGSMGRADLLRWALEARGRQYFDSGPAAIQEAALDGMAYLPADQDPVKVLGDLLRLANTAQLKKAVANAVATALRRLSG